MGWRGGVAERETVDRSLISLLLVLSSSDPARRAAGAWLAAFDSARAAGLSDPEAHGQAYRAWRLALGEDSGDGEERSGMLAAPRTR